MYTVPRRRLLKDFSLAAACLIPSHKSKKYQVTITCKAQNKQDFSEFIERSKKWENTRAIINLNEKYHREGKLLDQRFDSIENNLTHRWTYIFKDRKSFAKWNFEIYFGKLFKGSSIENKYSYSMEEKFA